MLIWKERPKEESSSSLVTNKLIWYTILFCFSVQVFIQHRRESPCFHLTIYSDFHFPLAAMINDFRRSNLSSVNSETLWHWIYRMAHRIVEVWCEKKSAFETGPHALFNSLEFGKLIVKWNHGTLQAYWMNFWTEKQKRILPNKFGDWWNFESSFYFLHCRL